MSNCCGVGGCSPQCGAGCCSTGGCTRCNARCANINVILEQLKQLSEGDDPESAHAVADTLLLELIDIPEITAAFNAIEKWYA